MVSIFMRNNFHGRFQGLVAPRILMIVFYRVTKGFVFWFLPFNIVHTTRERERVRRERERARGFSVTFEGQI